MELRKYNCPHCGATVNIDGDKDVFFCNYCGGQIVVDDGSQKLLYEESTNQHIEIDAKKEYTHNINDQAAVEKAKNEGFLNRYKVKLAIAGIAGLILISILIIINSIIKDANTKSYKPELKDIVVVDKNTTADFLEVVMDKIEEKSLLIVAEREVNVLIDLEQEGWIKWDVFKKSQKIRDYGIVQYTVDLHDIDEEDISYDEETNILTIYVPKAKIHEVTLEPEKREVGDPQNGFLAWGSIKLDQEKSAELEAESIEKIRQTAEDTIDKESIDDATEKAVKDLFAICVYNVNNSTKLRIKID